MNPTDKAVKDLYETALMFFGSQWNFDAFYTVVISKYPQIESEITKPKELDNV